MDTIKFQHHIWDLYRSISFGIDGSLRVTIESFGITMVQMRIMVELKNSGQSNISELSTAITSAAGNASTMCKKLEAKGLVKRMRNQDDQRIVHVALTDQGYNLLSQIEEELSVKYDPIFKEFSATDYEQILIGIGKLKEIFTKLQSSFCD